MVNLILLSTSPRDLGCQSENTCLVTISFKLDCANIDHCSSFIYIHTFKKYHQLSLLLIVVSIWFISDLG